MTKYVSLGGSCATTYNIRRIINTYECYPFDWAKLTIQQLNAVLIANFKDYEKLQIKKFSASHPLITFDSNTIFETKINDSDTEYGSLILTNSYGITFAHEIIKQSKIESFSQSLKEKRIKTFQNLSNRDKIVFIRLETGKLTNNYIKNLEVLLNNLEKLFGIDYQLRLIINECNKNIISEFDNYHVKIIYFTEFSSDWRCPTVDWNLVLF